METKIKNNFKAVEFMREVRNELSDIYHADKQRYHNELKKSMSDFLNSRSKPTPDNSIVADEGKS